MTFYFYDLETSGFSGRDDRIMQFGGQRTDMDFNPIGKPDNFLIKMTPDVLPQPDAVLVHGITPQKTLIDGISEAEFCKYLTSQVSQPDTIILGYNNIRFDNEFIRFTLWRNFYDAYEWSWKEGCSVWDLLDVVRMTRALRPQGISWPYTSEGSPTNKLEYLASVNKLRHDNAHDALSDVQAAIAVAKLLKDKQPKLFDYLFSIRHKSKIMPLVTSGHPLVYTSGRYPKEYNHTTVAVMVAEKADRSGALMYDLRLDPEIFINMSTDDLISRWLDRGEDAPYFPIKELKYNRCPALAPLEVLEKDGGYESLGLHKALVDKHLAKLVNANDFGDRLLVALESLRPKYQKELLDDEQQVDGRLYESFVPDVDKIKMSRLREAEKEELSSFVLQFKDSRLNLLLPLYKARNFPETLSEEESAAWMVFRQRKLLSGGRHSLSAGFARRLKELKADPGLGNDKQYLLDKLEQYAHASIPKSAGTTDGTAEALVLNK